MLRSYAAVGVTPLTVGLANTFSALPVVLATTDAGLDIATATSAAPKPVLMPTTTRTSVLDSIVHDDAAAPDDGVGPMRALHV